MSALNTPRTKSHLLIAHFDDFDKVTRAVSEVKQSLKNIHMVEALGEVVDKHNLSAPVVTTMQALPGFSSAVKEFPSSDLFSIVPEHKSSINQIQGLEALSLAVASEVTSLCDKAKTVVSSLENVLGGLSEVAKIYQIQLSSDRTRIDAIELPDTVFVGLPVYTMSEEGFSKFFTMLEKYLQEITEFNPDHLRDNPEQIREEIDSLTDIVGDLGDALGISVDEYGVYEKNKSDEYAPTASTFGEKGITKETLCSYLGRAYDLCDILKSISDRKDDLISALNKACEDIPENFNSDEYQYGANEHFILFTCYATLTTKLVREAVVLISRLIATADSVIELEEYHNDSENDTPVKVTSM